MHAPCEEKSMTTKREVEVKKMMTRWHDQDDVDVDADTVVAAACSADASSCDV